MLEQERWTLRCPKFREPGHPGVEAFAASQPDSNEHDHLFYEIVYIESGTGEHHSEAGVASLRAGDVVVLRPQVWHAYRRCNRLQIINCIFDSRLMQRFGGMLRRVEGAVALFHRRSDRMVQEKPVLLHLRPGQRPEVLDPLKRIMAESAERRSGWELACTAALLQVMIATARSSEGLLGEVSDLPTVAEQAVLEAVDYVENHFTQQVRLEDLSRRLYVSGPHLSRCFSRHMGLGVIAYVHRLRCEEACRLLQWTDQPIGHIAMEVGYNEIAYFSRMFRRETGLSPREYRRAKQTQSPGRLTLKERRADTDGDGF